MVVALRRGAKIGVDCNTIPMRPAVWVWVFGRVENINPDPYPAKPYLPPMWVYQTPYNP